MYLQSSLEGSDSVSAREPTIVVFHETVKEYTGHRNGTPRKVRVVVQALANLHSSRRVGITSQQREDIVLEMIYEDIAKA